MMKKLTPATQTKTPETIQEDALDVISGGAKRISSSVGKGGKFATADGPDGLSS